MENQETLLKLGDFVKNQRYLGIYSIDMQIKYTMEGFSSQKLSSPKKSDNDFRKGKWQVLIDARIKTPVYNKRQHNHNIYGAYSERLPICTCINEDLSLVIKKAWLVCQKHHNVWHDIDYNQYLFLMSKQHFGIETFDEWETLVAEENKARENGGGSFFYIPTTQLYMKKMGHNPYIHPEKDALLKNQERAEIFKTKMWDVIKLLKANK